MKVGDYIRTDEGIRKIIREYDIYYELDRSLHYMYPEGHDLNKKDVDDIVLKSSSNIIDLIQVGDYVNGVIVSQSYIDNIKHIAPEIKENNYGIKSIVTHEQFSQMEYKINRQIDRIEKGD